ncbi:MAG: glycoside hydrolase family 20 zincin-like fold domain-containing protein, partial [Planctomycetes bacterium]|nr:glycoside hydrolase family 20 zincin-like fold domain-containing protein [Planctomycetota bacterium]
MSASELVSELFRGGVMVLPEPQQASLEDGAFTLSDGVSVAVGAEASEPDRFAADVLVEAVKERFGLDLTVVEGVSGAVLLKREATLAVQPQGYTLTVSAEGVEVVGVDEPGLYYGVQTLIQVLRRNAAGEVEAPCCSIRDWPD